MSRNVIWIGSYPKSGNTWAHEVLRTAGKRWGFPPGPMDVYDMLRTGRRPEICTPVLKSVSAGPCSVLKSHSPFVREGEIHTFDDMPLKTVGFIYVYRNPLDLLLSYINYTRIEYAQNAEKAGYRNLLFSTLLGMEPEDSESWSRRTLESIPQSALDHALDTFSAGGMRIPTCMPGVGWADHVRGWLNARDQFPSVILRYEDCVTNPAVLGEMSRLFEFGPADIALAFKSTQARAHEAAVAGSPAERIFYNKMQAYYFHNYFSEDCIRRFHLAHAPILREFGYAEQFDGID